ncbi:YmaF family protein [Desulfosporosinus metallidurans]|uniref:YmaF family protein n=1 Tax=Desulfosporosinus metallidurans TaxID=1888891 RepID=UPI001F2796B0|nr:YmaF family protein [Desulfosporosinus metallidurans]
MAQAHVHQCSAVPTLDGSHVHHFESWVLYEHGHSHYYKSVSGPALPLPNGWHVHDWNFYTTVDVGHRHHVSGSRYACSRNLNLSFCGHDHILFV